MVCALPLLASYYTLAGDVLPTSACRASPIDIRERIEAAAAAGFRGMGLHIEDLERALERYSSADIVAMLDGNGLEFREIELLHGWFGIESSSTGRLRERDRVLELARILDVEGIKVGLSGEPMPEAALVQDLAHLCDVADDVSMLVEYSGLGQVKSLSGALSLIQECSKKNVGLILDLWHVMRAQTSLHELAALSKEDILRVEICDGSSVPNGVYLEETINARQSCGTGMFPIERFLTSVLEVGYRGAIGVEILSAENRARGPIAAAKEAFDSAWPFVDASWASIERDRDHVEV